jgi:molybdopterin-containing oxidoreductase family iron-sulfur binding subunit
VHDGVAEGSRFAAAQPSIVSGWGPALAVLADVKAPSGAEMELGFSRGSGVHDGRFANLGWLVELPDPITKLTWDNAALLNPEDAKALGVARSGDLLTVKADGKDAVLPASTPAGSARAAPSGGSAPRSPGRRAASSSRRPKTTTSSTRSARKKKRFARTR